MAGRRDLFEQAMTKGHSAAWDMQWDKAIACYRAALTEFPDDPNALTSLGFAMLQSDRPEEALAVYQRAAALAPGDPVAPEKCGEIFERLGRLNEASQTYMAVAEIHLTRRDVQKAIDNWARVARLTPDNLNAHSRLALAYERSGKPKEAVPEYLEVARIFQRQNEKEKAAQAVNRALQLDPQSADVRDAMDKLRKGLAIPVAARPRPVGVTGMLGGAAPAAFGAQVSPFLTEDESGGGAPPHKRASPLAASVEVALEHLAEMMFEEDADTSKAGSSVSAITKGTGLFRSGGRANRAQAVMYLGQAIGHQSSGEVEAAIQNYTAALDAGLENPLVDFALGALYLQSDRPAEAVEHLKGAVAREDVGMGALFGLGEAYRRAGKLREAVTHLLEALKRLDLKLTRSSPQKQDRLSEAYESLMDSAARASEADMARLAQSLAQFLSGDGWEDKAIQARKSLDSSADDGQAAPLASLLAEQGADRALDSMRLIDQYMARKLWGTAMEEAFYAIQHSPTYLPLHVRMAEILAAENKTETAAVKFAITAESYRVRGEVARAAKLMQEVLRINPLDVNVRAKLIEMLKDQGKIADALQQYYDLADTYYQLADLDTAREKFAEGLQLAQRSATDRAWNARFHKKLGDLEMQRLAWRDALRHFEQVKALAPDDEEVRISLIDLYFRLANAKQGVTELDEYLKRLLAARNMDTAKTLLEELAQSYPDEAAIRARLERFQQDHASRG
jgi:tetratricopeptide (TPR) repeat protein